MHDIADLDQRGLAGGFIASSVFADAVHAQAQALGFEPSVTYVAHPIQDRTDDEMRALAEAALDDVLAMIRVS